MKSLLKIPTTISPQTTQNSQQLANILKFGTKKTIVPAAKQQTLKTIPTSISAIKTQTTKPITRLATIVSQGQSKTNRTNRTFLHDATHQDLP